MLNSLDLEEIYKKASDKTKSQATVNDTKKDTERRCHNNGCFAIYMACREEILAELRKTLEEL